MVQKKRKPVKRTPEKKKQLTLMEQMVAQGWQPPAKRRVDFAQAFGRK